MILIVNEISNAVNYKTILAGGDFMTDILIVEDDKELADLLTDFLREEGYVVSSVNSGERAVHLFERYGARLVVLDINLPDMNGFAICSKLRENTDTPILIVSSRTGREDKLNGYDLGADDYIVKPFSVGEVMARVRAVLRRIDISRSDSQRCLTYDNLIVSLDNASVTLVKQKYCI